MNCCRVGQTAANDVLKSGARNNVINEAVTSEGQETLIVDVLNIVKTASTKQ